MCRVCLLAAALVLVRIAHAMWTELARQTLAGPMYKYKFDMALYPVALSTEVAYMHSGLSRQRSRARMRHVSVVTTDM